jgi:hypothetical protein
MNTNYEITILLVDLLESESPKFGSLKQEYDNLDHDFRLVFYLCYRAL